MTGKPSCPVRRGGPRERNQPGTPPRGRPNLLAPRLRSTPSLHRAPPRVRRCLPRPGRRHRHRPCPPPGRLVPLPLGHPTEITTHPLTYWRELLGRTEV